MSDSLSSETQKTIVQSAFDVPMGGNFPAIDFNEISNLLSDTFHLESLSISLESCAWDSKLSIEKKTHHFQEISSPLIPSLWVAIPKESQSALSTQFLQEDSLSLSFYDKELQDNFYLFILAEAIKKLQTLTHWNLLSMHIGTADVQLDDHMNIALNIQTQSTSIPFHILIPQPCYAGLERLYSSVPVDLVSRVPEDQYGSISINQGEVSLSKTELFSLKAGDFVRLDDNKKEQFAMLMINGIKLGDVFIENKKMTITEFSPTVGATMDEKEKSLDDIFDEKPQEEAKETVAVEDEDTIPLEKIDEIPYTVHVELGRITTPMKEIIQWKIGNQFPLPVTDPKKVYLHVNGTRIAQGELIQLEDCVGVKITEKK